MNSRIIFCAVAFAAAVRADEVSPPEGRGSGEAVEIVKRSLPFVKERGAAWIESRDCTSCHQVPSMLWSLNSAARFGLDVDKQELGERTTWAVDWRHWNQSGAKDGVDKVSSGNGHTMVSLLLGRAAGAVQNAEWTREFRAQLLKNQQADGSWTPGGQLPLGKRPARETAEVSTMWTLLALKSCNTDGGADADVRKRADAFLASAQPGTSIEWFVLKLLLEPGSESARAELLKQQHADGGWGWLAADPSDAFGTGLALYALARGGASATTEAIQRAVAFLKATQQLDGSWPVPSTRAKDKNKVIPTATYWGTAWAVIGLLELQKPPAES